MDFSKPAEKRYQKFDYKVKRLEKQIQEHPTANRYIMSIRERRLDKAIAGRNAAEKALQNPTQVVKKTETNFNGNYKPKHYYINKNKRQF